MNNKDVGNWCDTRMTTKILVEPVFDNKNLIREIRKIEKRVKIAEHLITGSTLPSKFHLKIKFIEGEKPEEIKLKNIRVINIKIGYEQTFSEISIPFKEENIICTGLYYIVFPDPGLYWLELEIESTPNTIHIETVQRMLNNEEGRGWSEHKIGEDGHPKKNFLRQPILVEESTTIYQMKLNRNLNRLTLIIVVLTIFFGLIEIGFFKWIKDLIIPQ